MQEQNGIRQRQLCDLLGLDYKARCSFSQKAGDEYPCLSTTRNWLDSQR